MISYKLLVKTKPIFNETDAQDQDGAKYKFQ